jgi:hypothetical protein
MSDETDATGERRRRWRLGSVAARFLVPERPQQQSEIGCRLPSADWQLRALSSTARPSPGEALGAQDVGSIENGQLCERGCQGPAAARA